MRAEANNKNKHTKTEAEEEREKELCYVINWGGWLRMVDLHHIQRTLALEM